MPFKTKKYLSLIFIIFACFIFSGNSFSEPDPEYIIVKFIDYTNKKEFKKAYQLLCSSARNDISYENFLEQSEKIIRSEIRKMKLIESGDNYREYIIKIWIILFQDEKKIKALYEGKASINRVNNKWYILSVEMKPTAAKSSDKKIIFGSGK